MDPRRQEAWQSFVRGPGHDWFQGIRIKGVRAAPLTPGGRARLTLFERVEGGRPHPRLQVTMPAAADPAPPDALFEPPAETPGDAEAFGAALDAAIAAADDLLEATDLPADDPTIPSPRFRYNTVRAQRRRRFFEEAGRWLDQLLRDGALTGEQAPACRYALRARRDRAFVGSIVFDDQDTGTYHSYRHDEPFVHYLEALSAQLPEEGSEAMELLSPEQRHAVRRQRAQVLSHLDHLMRHKYANHGVIEADVEKSVGGFLIDRRTRMVVSESPDSASSLVPAHELLRIDPAAEHPSAGEWVYRTADGLRLQDHSPVDGEPPLRRVGVEADRLTFDRAPEDEHRRDGVRLDWNGDGYVQDGEIGWISWAGHCDIKAVVEQLGITLTWDPAPSVTEYRSDTDEVTGFDRDLLLEMLCSVLELGSTYRLLDGSGRIKRGIQRFGGARNDSLPDRLQFRGPGEGRSFRWPLGGRREAFTVHAIEEGGQERDMDHLFLRLHPDPTELDFAPNPRFLKTLDGDCNLVDISGTKLRASVVMDSIDPATGYLSRSTKTTTLDLRPDAEPGRDLLGTHVRSARDRELFRVWLVRGAQPAVVAELERWEQGDEGWRAVPVPEETVRLPMEAPLTVTLSREMRRDNPRIFQELLDQAIRQGININADTSEASEVWNGTVLAIDNRRVAADRERRTEHWRVGITARFGRATLEYMLRRDEAGVVQEYCPVAPAWGEAPDFLWQEYPDVASKGVHEGDWVVNEAMVERGIVRLEWQPMTPGGVYVHDDHIKNVFELLFCGLGSYPYTVVHDNKRWGFETEEAWEQAKTGLSELRERLVEPEGTAAST